MVFVLLKKWYICIVFTVYMNNLTTTRYNTYNLDSYRFHKKLPILNNGSSCRNIFNTLEKVTRCIQNLSKFAFENPGMNTILS